MALVIGAAACESDPDEPGAGPADSATSTEVTGDEIEEASVSILRPRQNRKVRSPVRVRMRASDFQIEPAGEIREGAGHFHLLVDTDCLEPGDPIPEDDQHIHLGDGSDQIELELPPGKHRLCLQVGNGEHVALDLIDTASFRVVTGRPRQAPEPEATQTGEGEPDVQSSTPSE